MHVSVMTLHQCVLARSLFDLLLMDVWTRVKVRANTDLRIVAIFFVYQELLGQIQPT